LLLEVTMANRIKKVLKAGAAGGKKAVGKKPKPKKKKKSIKDKKKTENLY
jgi:hypothetical protein